MQKFFSMMSLAAVMFAFAFVMTPNVAHAFIKKGIEVSNIKFEPQKNAIRVGMKFSNDEDRPIKFLNFECYTFTISDPSGKQVFNSNGSFTVQIDSEDDLIVPAHSSKTWAFTLNKKYAPNMTNVPNATYNYNAGWKLFVPFTNVECVFAEDDDDNYSDEYDDDDYSNED